MKLEQGKNCWRISRSHRARLLIDTAAYFREFRKAVINAEHRIVISAWDIHSRIDLVRSGEDDGYPHLLSDFLMTVLKKNKNLHIYILLWDFAMIYAFERDWSPVFNYSDWRKHRRLHLVMDGKHPVGASHHQKIVTIDDKIAFTGGIDLSKWRWDTPSHHAEDKRRTEPGGEPYKPFHDIQVMMTGPIVKEFNDLLAERWYHAAGSKLPDSGIKSDLSYWPSVPGLEFYDNETAISRTYIDPNTNEPFLETKQAHIDAIRSARNLIYIENQFFSSSVAAKEIIDKLKTKEGPEVVIILPLKTGGWLEQATMDVLRNRLLYLMQKADKYNRLRVYYPLIDSEKNLGLFVHSKLLVIDDKILKVGSSNLSNRSMSLDSECDIIITADNDNIKISEKIRDIRHHLLSEFMGIEPAKYAGTEQIKGKMIDTIEALNKGNRRLEYLHHNIDEKTVDDIAALEFVDPEKPVGSDQLIDHFVGKTRKKSARKNIIRFVMLIAVLIAMAVIWAVTPIGDYFDKQTISDYFETAGSMTWTHLYYSAAFVILSVIGIPVTVLIGSIGILFGPWWGSITALIVTLSAAILSYLIGSFTGKNLVRTIAGEKINNVSKQLAKRGIWTIIFIRIVPVAPFAVINLLAGASHIKFRDYTFGTIVGMTPGILLLTMFFGQLVEIFRETTVENIILMVILIVIMLSLSIIAVKLFYSNKTVDKTDSVKDEL